MSNTQPQRDPERAWVRNAVAARRVGVNAECSICRERRPQALIQESDPKICHACKRQRDLKTPMDKHHVAGEANSPITLRVPVNDHRAELSPAQYDWPKATLENPSGSPLVAHVACVRGFADTNSYLVRKLLLEHAEFWEIIDAFLTEKFGSE